jgi:hypothetical protein
LLPLRRTLPKNFIYQGKGKCPSAQLSTRPRRRIGGGVIAPLILDLGTRRWVVSFTGRAAATHWIGGWVGPTAGLYAVEKIPSSRRESSPGTLIVQPVTSYYINWATWTLYFTYEGTVNSFCSV